MPGGSRTLHTKSRNGCGQCKRRRVKCDQKPPCCGNCQRRKESCDYSVLVVSKTRPEAKIPKAETLALLPKSSEKADHTSIRWEGGTAIWNLGWSFPLPRQQTELLTHYLTSTASTLALLVDMQRIWQHEIPMTAQCHTFLFHGLLAVTALHLSHLHTSNELKTNYSLIAYHYHTTASNIFRSITSVNSANSTAIFAFCLVMAMFHFRCFASPADRNPIDSFDSLIIAISALRSARSLAHQSKDLIDQGPIGALFRRRRKITRHPLDNDTRQALDDLHALNDNSAGTSAAEVAIYRETIESLQRVVTPFPKSWIHLVNWQASISLEFFSLLQQKRPMALIILAHWCVLVNRVPYRWYIEGWAAQAVRSIISNLGAEWRVALKWVSGQFGMSLEQPMGDSELKSRVTEINLVIENGNSFTSTSVERPDSSYHQLNLFR